MTTLPNQLALVPNNVTAGVPACEGRKSITTQIDFSLGLTFQLDLTAIENQQFVRSIQTIYCDNSGNPNPVTITMGVTLQSIVIPRNSCAYIPLLLPVPSVIKFVSTQPVIVKVQLLNFFLPPYVWSAFGAANQYDLNGNLKTADQNLAPLVVNNGLNVNTKPNDLATITNDSTTITTGGTVQTLFVANLSRQRFIVSNPSNATEVLQIIFGATTNGRIDLLPGATWDESNFSVYAGVVYVVAATSGHAFTAYEV